MKINYDKVADAIYFAIKKGKVSKTVEIKDSMIVDLDKKGKVIGIEILNYSEHQNSKSLLKSIKNGVPFTITEESSVFA